MNHPLVRRTVGYEETLALLSVITSGRFTMGQNVAKFEEAFARCIGKRYGIMVNSGSSANLLMFALLHGNFTGKDKVITSPLAWSTSITPLYWTRFVPKFVDVQRGRFSPASSNLEKAIDNNTAAIYPIHILGFPWDMPKIMEIAERYGLMVVEDACESYGSTVAGKQTGSFGRISTFSFFYSHHITTVEGGMLLTDDEQLANRARSLRAHGWTRERSDRAEIEKNHMDIDPKFLFVEPGFNLKPTEFEGALGLVQLQELPSELAARRENADYWNSRLNHLDKLDLPEHTTANTEPAWFGYPIVLKQGCGRKRSELASFLEGRGIETRPIMAGNILKHPVMSKIPHEVVGSLEHAQHIMDEGLYVGNHSGVTAEMRSHLVDCVEDFFA